MVDSNYIFVLIAFPFTFIEGHEMLHNANRKHSISSNEWYLAKQKCAYGGRVVRMFKEEALVHEYIRINANSISENGYNEYLCIERHSFYGEPFSCDFRQKDILWFQYLNEKYEIIPRPECLDGIVDFI